MKRIFTGILLTFATLFAVVLLPSTAFAQTGDAGAGCALPANTRMNPARQTAVNNVVTANAGATVESFSCQNTSGVSDTNISANCVSGLCPGGENIRCCVRPIAAMRPGAGGDAPGDTPAPSRAPTGLVLPSCVSDGDCQLDDIIQTGVNFANFLFGISGAIFLAIFVYAGILYLTAGGAGDRVGKAKKMLTQATIGMLLVVGAGVLVTFIYNAFRGGSSDRCETTHAGFSCTTLPAANLSTEIRTRGCVTELCPGADTNVCCPATR